MSGVARVFIRTSPRRTLVRQKQMWLTRTSSALGQVIGGFLDVEILGWNFKGLRRFKFLPGNTGRTQCEPMWQQQRRKRHETGNSSINLLLALAVMAVGLTAKAGPGASVEQAKIEQLGNDFEAMMLQFLFNQLQQNNALMDAGEDSPFAPSPAKQIFRGMRDEEMVKRVAETRPLGFGDTVVRHIRGEGGISSRPLVKPETASAAPVAD